MPLKFQKLFGNTPKKSRKQSSCLPRIFGPEVIQTKINSPTFHGFNVLFFANLTFSGSIKASTRNTWIGQQQLPEKKIPIHPSFTAPASTKGCYSPLPRANVVLVTSVGSAHACEYHRAGLPRPRLRAFAQYKRAKQK